MIPATLMLMQIWNIVCSTLSSASRLQIKDCLAQWSALVGSGPSSSRDCSAVGSYSARRAPLISVSFCWRSHAPTRFAIAKQKSRLLHTPKVRSPVGIARVSGRLY